MAIQAPGIVPPGGTHLLIDMFGAGALTDLEYVKDACVRAAEATGATVIGEAFHHFGEGCGISGVVILAESHLAIHTWPEQQIATIDVFVCGSCVARGALPILMAAFLAERMVLIERQRGVEGAVSEIVIEYREGFPGATH
jgi:S-adenosylmethionine decarboxylase